MSLPSLEGTNLQGACQFTNTNRVKPRKAENGPIVVVFWSELGRRGPCGVVSGTGVEGGGGYVCNAEDGVDALSVADGGVVVEVGVRERGPEALSEGGVLET